MRLYKQKGNYLSVTFADSCNENARFLGSALYSFKTRLSTLYSYEDACKNTQKKLETLEKLRTSTSINQEKVDHAIDELALVIEQMKKHLNYFTFIYYIHICIYIFLSFFSFQILFLTVFSFFFSKQFGIV